MNIRSTILFLLGFLCCIAHANQCYPDAQSAYNALITKQQMTVYTENNFIININTTHPSELISLKAWASNKILIKNPKNQTILLAFV